MVKEKSSTDELITQIIKGVEDVKGKDIQLLDLQEIDNSPCDYFIVCNGNSNTQVAAIVNAIRKNVSKELLEKPYHTEGLENAEWVLMDYIDVVVHVFQRQTRDYYNIEGLWGDAKSIPIASNY